MRYVGPPIREGQGLVLFDDVRTQGDTTQACIHRVMEATTCSREHVVRVFLAKTIPRS